MNLTVLVDNNTYIDQYYLGEPAVSYYIEDKNTKILFDTGYSDIFIRNAEKINIDLKKLDKIAISHGHNDHTLGLKYYFEEFNNSNITIVAHPDAFKEKIMNNLEIGSPILEDELIKKCNLMLSEKPIKISENITLLGSIPKMNDFEKRICFGRQLVGTQFVDDYVLEDTALVYQNPQGIYIVTGCSHSGICNIIEYAKKVCNEKRVLGFIGGFHLFNINEQVLKTIDYLKANNIPALYPCHCTSLKVKAEMINKGLPVHEVGVGLKIKW